MARGEEERDNPCREQGAEPVHLLLPKAQEEDVSESVRSAAPSA